MSTMVNVLGAGFVGSRYAELTPNVIVNERNDYEVKSNEVLYFISTIDNYNVWTDPYIDIDTNLTTLIKTLESCKGKDVTFNFVSSWFVYGNVELPAKETAYCDPKGFYSITKRTAEQLLISYCETFGIKYRILRLANVLGETDKKVSKKKNALQYMIGELKAGNPIQLYNGGMAFRDYIYVDDVVQAINLVLEKGKTNEIYNIGNGVAVPLVQAISYAAKKLNSQSKIENIETAEFHKIVQTTNMVLDISKITGLGYNQNYTITDIIDKLIV
ncbi:MAG: NAD-dependent epimerase/dehydratase family protein [Proteobacteria bacterium]|nr:NAD-dependent epimerase/dehydratase family protein [Pseudomonadota bacterium]